MFLFAIFSLLFCPVLLMNHALFSPRPVVWLLFYQSCSVRLDFQLKFYYYCEHCGHSRQKPESSRTVRVELRARRYTRHRSRIRKPPARDASTEVHSFPPICSSESLSFHSPENTCENCYFDSLRNKTSAN